MNDAAIRVENLSKQYHIGKKREKYPMLRDRLANAVAAPFRRAGKLLRGQTTGAAELDETIWALRDISFEVEQGEVVGIVGPNGAGKSTLLKILSRVTEPTSGSAVIRGRVRSLLEVGTGFHQELTGRENIYLNSAILGMRRAEIDRKFDEIVAFAEVEKFIDTPVKHYSSGMQVRLGFAIAAHLEPEILIVDEVLAVGDAAFRRKCLEKMGNVAKEGRTVLFVSHNMVAVQTLCQRAIWLHQGRLKQDGEVAEVISDYLHLDASSLTEQTWEDIKSAPGNGIVRLHRVRVRPKEGSPSDPITMETPFVMEIEYWNQVPDTHLHIVLHMYTEQQIIAFGTNSSQQGRILPAGLFRSVCCVPGNLLNSGLHRVVLFVVKDRNSVIYKHPDVLMFEVLDLTKREGAWYGKRPGAVRPMLEWTTELVRNAPEIE